MLNRGPLNQHAVNGIHDGFVEAELQPPRSSISGSILTGLVLEAELEQPLHESSGFIVPEGAYALLVHDVHEVESEIAIGFMFEAELLQPATQAAGEIRNRLIASIEHPLAEVSSSMVKAWYAYLDQPVAVVASSLAQGASSIALRHPRANVSISVLVGNVFGADLTHPLARVAADEGFSLDLEHPAARVAASLVGDIMAQVALVQPRARVSAQLALMVETVFRTFAMNTERAAVSEYTNFDTLAIIRIGNAYAAICPDGIYQLGTDDDNGEPINATARFGKDDMGSDYQKRVLYAYIGGRGRMGMRMHTDNGRVSPEHLAGHDGIDYGTSRIKLGKGTKSRYWQPEITNLDGADMEIDVLNLIGEQLSRRVS